MDIGAVVEEGGGSEVIEDDKDVGNDEAEMISDTATDMTNGSATADEDVESDEESVETDQLPSESKEEDQFLSSASERSPSEEAESGNVGPDEKSMPPETSTYQSNNNQHRSAWIAHGLIGFLVFGIFVPIVMSSAMFRDFIPHGWIYVHTGTNLVSFVMTFFAVGIAFATMNGTITVEGGHHMDERHHVVGLLLLLLMSFQVANGFLHPLREFITNDGNDNTPGAIFRSNVNVRGIRPRILWYLVHAMSGTFLFGLGAYQVQSGLGLYAKRFGSFNWSSAYIVYLCSLGGLILAGKSWIVWKEPKRVEGELSSQEIQMSKGSKKIGYGVDDLIVAKWETV
ncbi:hypothetical protein ACHAXA_005388 [Cyclostephanos tholiformis]|uniref:Cytochrome b561 domain-containing protein n=1 Tax=Cyclostephanos tholiformis TaxID=382380 RepID=A0ABD3RD75_9STRA